MAREHDEAAWVVADLSGGKRGRRQRHGGCTSATRQCEFWTWGEGYRRPPCCTAHLLELAAFVDSLLDRHGITHWLDFGSLLGAVREGELIAWDEDVDFGCLRSDWPRVAGLASEVAAAGYELDASQSAVIQVRYSKVNFLHVDIFGWHEADSLLHIQGQWTGWPGMHDRFSFPRRCIEQLEWVALNQLVLPAPRNAGDFLSAYRYGPGWVTPKRPLLYPQCFPSLGDADVNVRALAELVEQVGRSERRLVARWSSTALPRFRLWQWWACSGLPRSVRVAARAKALEEVGADADESPSTVLRLAEAVALLRRIEHERTPLGAVAALGRRAAKAARLLGDPIVRRARVLTRGGTRRAHVDVGVELYSAFCLRLRRLEREVRDARREFDMRNAFSQAKGISRFRRQRL